MATVEELIVEMVARDNGATAELDKVEGRIDKLTNKAKEGSRKAVAAAGNEARKTGQNIEDVSKKATKATKDIGESGKKTLDIFGKLKSTMVGFIGAAALFSLGKTIVSDVVKADLALGELSRTTNRNVKDVQGLQRAWEQAGKSGDLASQHLAEWGKLTSEFETTGEFNHRFANAAALLGGGIKFRENGQFRNYEDILFDLGERAKSKFGGDAARKLQGMGLSADEADVATHQSRQLVRSLQAQADASDESIQKSEELNRQWKEFTQTMERLEREIFLKLQPTLEKLMQWLSELADEIARDPEVINDMIAAVGALAVAFGLIFNPIGTAMALFIGFMAVLTKATNKFETVRKVWNGLVLAIKEGLNTIIPYLADFLRSLGMTDIADKLDSFRFNTSSEEQAVSADAWARANVTGESGKTGGVGRDGRPIRNLNSGKRFGRYNGTYDVGMYQLNETNGPMAARLAGVSWDRSRFFNDVGYANQLGLAYMNHTRQEAARKFGNDPAKAFAYYHSPKAMTEASRYGANWMGYLKDHWPLVYASTTKKMQLLSRGGGSPSYSAGASTMYGGRTNIDNSRVNTTNNYNYTFNGVRDAEDAANRSRRRNQGIDTASGQFRGSSVWG